MRSLYPAVLSLAAILLLSPPAASADLVTKASAHSVASTLDRLEALLVEKGIGVMARIDHSANAESVGLELAPSELLLFGDPAKGTLLMQQDARVGLDLPMRALAWQDEQGGVWLSYVPPSAIVEERGVSGVAETAAAMDQGLDKLTAAAVAP